MSTYEDNVLDSVIKPSLPYIVPASKYAILFINDNSSLNNYSYYMPFASGETIPSIAPDYLIKVYDE